MKRSMTILGMLVVVALLAGTAYAGDFSAVIACEKWDGEKVPEGQQCQKFGGTPKTPPLKLGGVPEGTNIIVLEFNDTTYEPMDNGGHGMVGYALPSPASALTIPSAPGHTFMLPAGFFTFTAHRGAGWDLAGAYLAPCSGGKGNMYTITVKALQVDGEGSKVLAETTVDMGRF